MNPASASFPVGRTAIRSRAAGVVAAVASLGLAALAPGPCRAERPRIYAITGAHVVAAPGSVIEDGCVVLRDGLIEHVGGPEAVPADAEVIDATGNWVYPGLIDAHSRLGPRAPDGARPGGSSRSESARAAPTGAVHPIERIRPESRARDGWVPFANEGLREMERLRNLGFTTVLATPRAGVLRGRSVALQLAEERPVAELILRDDVAQHAAFERGRFGESYPSSLMGAAAALRQTLLDARRYVTWHARHNEHPQAMRRPRFHAAFEALRPVISGEQRLVFDVDDPHDALLAHRIGAEFDLLVAVSGSGHEWEIAEQIAATGRELLLPVGFPDKPEVDDDLEALDVSRRTMRRYLDAASGPVKLHAAGVRFALTTRGLKSAADFPKNVRKMIAAGLPADVALASVTTVPAELLGLDQLVGTLEPGKVANVLVADGPLFEEDSRLRHVFVDGTKYDVEAPSKPEGDPDAVVDPRGIWSVVFDMGARTMERSWTVSGERDRYSGTAETRSGIVSFDEVTLEGNVLSVVFPARGDRGSLEVSVVIVGDEFEGVSEMGPRSVDIKGTRTSGPEVRR